MTYFPLRQTTCFFIPLVAPCKPLLMNAYVKKLYFPIVIPHTGVFPYLAVYDQLSGLSITPEELNLTL